MIYKYIYCLCLFGLEQNSFSGYGQVSTRLTAMVFYDVQSLPRGFPRKHFSCIRKSYSGHLVHVLFQTNKACMCVLLHRFYLLLWHVIRVALIVRRHGVQLQRNHQPKHSTEFLTTRKTKMGFFASGDR